MDSLA